MLDQDTMKRLGEDPDGLVTYEYIANHINLLDNDEMTQLVDNMTSVDHTGQFVVSAARYLYATDPVTYAAPINALVAAAIDKDREHRYIGSLLEAMYGHDYRERADELSAADDNFRRIYKRLYGNHAI